MEQTRAHRNASASLTGSDGHPLGVQRLTGHRETIKREGLGSLVPQDPAIGSLSFGRVLNASGSAISALERRAQRLAVWVDCVAVFATFKE